ncbi:dual specificity protein kinase shkA-like [Corticium candelabrum]|uniref:dual specificity protein kinase shkA-like n=1 Tax=Corticium candelabrum TaxID=121492 RepID=UPI002E25B1FB|nr:dual specificity protein kinase shkA-like [Corticium candelabrum]
MIDVLLKKRTDIVSFDKPFISHAGGIWNGAVVYYGTVMESPNGTLLAIGKQCKPGAAQVEGPAASCVTCSIGKYHASIRGVAECLKCPTGTTTKKEGSRSVTDCICEPDYCGHGSCKVLATDGAVCSCPFIFVGNRCNNINYFLIVMILGGLTGFVVVTTALVCCGLRTIRHRRSRRRTEKELEETRKAFTILSQEIELQGRLDEDCPGGYGQVHKARYRDWTVAVKQLQLVMMEWADIRREFLREIQFMRTVRHPNIVMFIGAGQYEEVQPFLVVEFMSGGALRSLLDNDDVQLTLSDQLRFVLDTAEGMKHLHMLDPPRIHRDLKSANLLLSEKRRVKVSDFGSARLIPRVNGNESRRANNREREDDMPLLSSSSHLTQRFIGTSRWRSPELWKKEIYGTATDVYSFAIVVWEIVTRQTPFSGNEYKFDARIEDAVITGVRPTLPAETDKGLRYIIEQCWQGKPKDRPTFVDIVVLVRSILQSTQQSENDVIDVERQYSFVVQPSNTPRCVTDDLDATRSV